jgi:putative ABC transport system permease protein
MADALWLDVRHCLRRLRQSPGLSFVIIATIVLVLVANVAIFSLLNAIVLRKVSVPAPDEVVGISAADAKTNQTGYFYADTVAAFRSAQRSFTHLAMYNGGGTLPVELPNVPAITSGLEVVSPEYFDLMRVTPLAGRFFGAADDGGAPAVVLSSRFAERLFGAAAAAAGQTVIVSGIQATVLGVMPPGFTGLAFDAGADLYVSFPALKVFLVTTSPGTRAPTLIGRLAPGVSFDEARAELAGRWSSIQEATIGTVPAAMRAQVGTQRVQIEPLAHGFSGLRRQYGMSLQVLMGLAAILLAVGAVNLSGLLLARSIARDHQFAIQRALGASGTRLIRQSVIDGVLLAGAGLVIALPLAWWISAAVGPMLAPRALPRQYELTPSFGVIAIAVVVTLITGILMGVLPARRALAASITNAVRTNRSLASGLGWTGRTVIVTQVALAMVLVSGAGLFVATLANLYANDSSARTKPIVWTRLGSRTDVRSTPTETDIRRLHEALSTVNGVDAAALSFYYPAYLGFPGVTRNTTISLARDTATSITGMTEFISPRFFEVTGINRVRGRDFDWTDGPKAPAVAIISESAASQLAASGDPIGQELQVVNNGVQSRVVVVGVVADAPIGRLDDPHVPVVFRPMTQNLVQAVVPIAFVRVAGDVATVRDSYVNAVNGLGRNQVRALFTMDEWVDGALLQQRLVAGVSSTAAFMAVLLAALGIFGVLAYSVAARSREIGIRMSIGATPSSIVRMVVREGVIVAALGIIVGGPIALAASGLIRSLLYGISARDPKVLVAAAVLFVITSLSAAGLPAWRASKVSPVDALRQE